tara:strand:+ start:112 stop:549 length:438 start_codon:yes stop_codon:yes gene_type:complete
MKNFNTIDTITLVGIMASLALLLLFSGCSHGFYLQGHKIAKTNDECCKRLSLRAEQMSTFNRYCKVALFLSKSTNKAVGKVVQKNATAAVKVCKFVFKVETDEELVAAGDEQEYHRVRSYIITPDEGFWRHSLPCDPAESACEEF